MSNGGSRTYLIEHWVRSNLRSHQGKPFTFEVDGAKVAVLLPAASGEADGFVTQTQLQGDAVLLAERAAHDAVTAMLDVLCYEMRVTGLVVRSVRSQVEGSGPTRRCVVYGHEPKQRSLFLMKETAEEVNRIIADQPDIAVRRALYWLRWTYNSGTLPEAFLFAWMALERLAGEQQVVARCSGCGEPVGCPKHGHHHYSTVPRSAIKALLERHGVANIETLLKLRNPLVHGSLEHNFMQRLNMKQTLPNLVRAIEEELRTRLKATEALRISPLAGPGDLITMAHCEYRTEFAGEAFPPDCPTFGEVKEYEEAIRRGRQHPKIINLPPPPADW